MPDVKQEELDEIRALVANEPETSYAKRLLAEIDRRDEEDKKRGRAKLHASLLHHWGLDDAEANVMLALAETGDLTFEYERGMCRKCDGDGHVQTGSGCFGGRFEQCPNCDGSGIDGTRLKVPGFVYECTCHPEWWEGRKDRNREHPRMHMHGCPKRRGPYEKEKPVAESEM
jgi:hypothetical protein